MGSRMWFQGLGGSLILLLLGIYEQFVDSVGNLFVERRRWREHLAFLIPFGIGMVVGVLALANLVTLLLDRHPAPTMFFFMGLLVGTIPSVLRIHKDMRFTPGRGVTLLLGLLFVVVLRSVGPAGEEIGAQAGRQIVGPGMIVYATVISFLAGGASVTPGLDGSYVLLLGDTYHPIIDALAALRHLDSRWGALLTTAIGAGLGIIIFSKLIDAAIKRAPSLAYYCVLGLVIGSVYGLWPRGVALDNIPLLALSFIVGLLLAFFFSKTPEPTETLAQSESVSDPRVPGEHISP